MVRRNAHTAIITLESGGKLVEGEWKEGTTETIEVKGHYDAASDARIIVRRNSNGDEKQVSGYFYTGKKPLFDGTPTKISIKELDISVPVICWDPYQSHSVICV